MSEPNDEGEVEVVARAINSLPRRTNIESIARAAIAALDAYRKARIEERTEELLREVSDD